MRRASMMIKSKGVNALRRSVSFKFRPSEGKAANQMRIEDSVKLKHGPGVGSVSERPGEYTSPEPIVSMGRMSAASENPIVKQTSGRSVRKLSTIFQRGKRAESKSSNDEETSSKSIRQKSKAKQNRGSIRKSFGNTLNKSLSTMLRKNKNKKRLSLFGAKHERKRRSMTTKSQKPSKSSHINTTANPLAKVESPPQSPTGPGEAVFDDWDSDDSDSDASIQSESSNTSFADMDKKEKARAFYASASRPGPESLSGTKNVLVPTNKLELVTISSDNDLPTTQGGYFHSGTTNNQLQDYHQPGNFRVVNVGKYPMYHRVQELGFDFGQKVLMRPFSALALMKANKTLTSRPGQGYFFTQAKLNADTYGFGKYRDDEEEEEDDEEEETEEEAESVSVMPRQSGASDELEDEYESDDDLGVEIDPKRVALRQLPNLDVIKSTISLESMQSPRQVMKNAIYVPEDTSSCSI